MGGCGQCHSYNDEQGQIKCKDENKSQNHYHNHDNDTDKHKLNQSNAINANLLEQKFLEKSKNKKSNNDHITSSAQTLTNSCSDSHCNPQNSNDI